MTSPSHGGGPEFESQRAHLLFCKILDRVGIIFVYVSLMGQFVILDAFVGISCRNPCATGKGTRGGFSIQYHQYHSLYYLSFFCGYLLLFWQTVTFVHRQNQSGRRTPDTI